MCNIADPAKVQDQTVEFSWLVVIPKYSTMQILLSRARRLALMMALAMAALSDPVEAGGPKTPQNVSLAPWAQPAAEACMLCSAKCSKCAKSGTDLSYTNDQCQADCKKAGNPMVNATCGIRQRC